MNSTLQDMRARLEEAFRRPALSAEFDPKSIEDLARRIEGVRGAIENRGDSAPTRPTLGWRSVKSARNWIAGSYRRPTWTRWARRCAAISAR